MTDSLDEIRRWHKLSLDKTSEHWEHVDTLLAGGFGNDDADQEPLPPPIARSR